MAKKKYWIAAEPTGSSYSRLIDFCAKRCPKCTLVVQRPQRFSATRDHFLETLKEHLIEISKQAEWPGTKLTRSLASVHWYSVNRDLVNRIKETTNGLYEWAAPDLPEDLAFYSVDGVALLGTSSHERFAFLVLEDRDLEDFQTEVPNLSLNTEITAN